MDQVKLPPHDRGAEAALLGSVFSHNEVIDQVAGIVKPADFYVAGYQEIYRGQCAMRSAGLPIDVVTLSAWLKDRGLLENVGGYDSLSELWGAAPSAANARQYAEIVRAKAGLRKLIHVCNDLIREAYDPSVPPAEALERAQRDVFEVVSAGCRATVKSQQEAVDEFARDLDRRCGTGDGEVDAPYVPTMWDDLDDLIIGLHRRELIVVAARPSLGKTMLAVNLIRQVAGSQGIGTFMASLEQSTGELIHRLVCQRAQVHGMRLRRGELEQDERARILDAFDMSGWPVWYDDTPGQSVTQVASAARLCKAQHRIGLILVDYLQLVDAAAGRRYERRAEEVGHVAKALKNLARELDVPVVALAQLNRELEKRAEKEPVLADLKESGDIEQAADTVMLLWKREEPDDLSEVDIISVKVAKQRNGPTGQAHLAHRKRYFEITSLLT